VDCIEESIKRNENKLFRTALAIMGGKADAEDVIQIEVTERGKLRNAERLHAMKRWQGNQRHQRVLYNLS
jgi:hypothetical protein